MQCKELEEADDPISSSSSALLSSRSGFLWIASRLEVLVPAFLVEDDATGSSSSSPFRPSNRFRLPLIPITEDFPRRERVSPLAFFSSSSGRGAKVTLEEREAVEMLDIFEALDRQVQTEDAKDDDDLCLFTILGIGIVG